MSLCTPPRPLPPFLCLLLFLDPHRFRKQGRQQHRVCGHTFFFCVPPLSLSLFLHAREARVLSRTRTHFTQAENLRRPTEDGEGEGEGGQEEARQPPSLIFSVFFCCFPLCLLRSKRHEDISSRQFVFPLLFVFFLSSLFILQMCSSLFNHAPHRRRCTPLRELQKVDSALPPFCHFFFSAKGVCLDLLRN